MSLIEWFKNRRRRRLSYYSQQLALYRQKHPESLEKDQEQIQRWVAYVEARRRAQQELAREEKRQEEGRLTSALQELHAAAYTAFMSHPAATEADFRRCWPNLREEILKQHALQELAANPTLLSSLLKATAEDSRSSYRLISSERQTQSRSKEHGVA